MVAGLIMGDCFIMYINVELLCCTPEINVILYVNYASVKKASKRILSLTGYRRNDEKILMYFGIHDSLF